MEVYKWARRNGYECSTKGDKRFSALCARMPDGRTIEEHYQCDVKGYDVGGTNWKLGKGKPAIREVDLWSSYLILWTIWALNNPIIYELKDLAKHHNNTLSDCFANTEVNQARALSVILNMLKD